MTNLGLVISAFPGTGKSYIAERISGVSDSDSSDFPKEGFPGNYLDAIEERRKISRIVLVSSHANVRHSLYVNQIPYIVVYPDRVAVNEYKRRYERRGSPDAFIEMMATKWDAFIDSISNDKGALLHIKLPTGAYLADYFYPARHSDTIGEARTM